ncbi:4-alpha-glucanotransferase [Olsenella sp. HMSC062G07]|uniref:4-alpha-glucanotransferase n=1 Tax=Olsenella sp. HMSC062G07 TaxID=1739330 RepID=UPI0008A58B7B|nr:4-alpha-glucanotransferase [Olsenella sp. HMSC062G07]OFK22139.1 4-alpha-glucanotransferase [Olsenella sp. HMSC062G07]
MRAKHVTSELCYRNPFGAVQSGGAVSLSLDVWDEPAATARLRLWVDERGERLLDMRSRVEGDHLRFSVTFVPDRPEVVWYSFQVQAADGTVWRYGAAREHACGEGAFAYGEPPSFQLTVYDAERGRLPAWYAQGVVYQIFPDRFARGAGWREQVEGDLATPYRGPERRLVERWDTYPSYERNADGSIAAWDFYGGTLEGIRERLDYLRGLGVSVLYLNPIFAASSNHRYDTVDYLRIDGALGTKEDFCRLCADAEARGISIILDGVFNHVGADSKYFNRAGVFAELGAFQGDASPYRSWFTFRDDGSYDAWWGVEDLPAVRDDSPEFRELICGYDGVVRTWLRLGARGWRLDVADELSDEFIEDIKSAALAERPDAVVIGEVWEDASHKVSYGRLRRYFQGSELDGTMNYPLRSALLGFVTNNRTAGELAATLQSLHENYPPQSFAGELNLLGSHDRRRLLTVLGDAPQADELTDDERRVFRLGPDERSRAVSRLWVAALLQMCLPGVPSVYYGDEAGLEGYADPYCRATFPWGHVDEDCFAIYRNAIALRRALPPPTDGSFEPFSQGDDVFGFWRRGEGGSVCVLANASLTESRVIHIRVDAPIADDVVSGARQKVRDGQVEVRLWPLGTAVIHPHEELRLQRPLERGLGVMCHITSLPNLERPGHAGTLGEPARRFIDMLARAGARYWQVLPVNPTDEFGSPYAGLSAFAGNVSLMWGIDDDDGPSVLPTDFEGTSEFRRFVESNERWLLPYATFRAIKDRMGDTPWQEWPSRYRSWHTGLPARRELKRGVRRVLGLQFAFMRQWGELRRYAHERGVAIIGDMPMYVSADSSDVWAERELFSLGEDGLPAEVAGCPPDAFAAAGQVWGNPTYDWERHRKDGFSWWLRRLERAFELYDYVRLDHFLGFSSYFSIPAGASASEGRWNYAPGLELFKTAHERLGALPVVAEDLGSVTPAVRALTALTGFPGMDIIQFQDTDVREGYHPAAGSVAYSSTHDTNTLLGWVVRRYGFHMTDSDDRHAALDVARRLLSACADAPSDVVILPLQDLLLLGEGARMNVPGVACGNWQWQAEVGSLDAAREVLHELVSESGR